jgi:hypothetical protein
VAVAESEGAGGGVIAARGGEVSFQVRFASLLWLRCPIVLVVLCGWGGIHGWFG